MSGGTAGRDADCQPPEQGCQSRGNNKILEMTAEAAANIAAMEPFYTRTEPQCWSQGAWGALLLFRRKAHFYS